MDAEETEDSARRRESASVRSSNATVAKEVFIEFDQASQAETAGIGLRNNTNDLWFGFGTRNQLGGHDEMVLARNGNLGLGTSSAATALEIRRATANGPTLRLTGNGGAGARAGIDFATTDATVASSS